MRRNKFIVSLILLPFLFSCSSETSNSVSFIEQESVDSSVSNTLSLSDSTTSIEEAKTQFEVSFQTYGGTTFNTQIVNKGECATYPGTPVLEDHTFHGFYLKDGYLSGNWGNKFYFEEEPIYENLTLYAKFIKDIYYQVSFYSQGVLLSSIDRIKPNTTIEPIIPNEIEGKIFVGYVIRGEDSIFDFETPINQDYIFDAKWEDKNSIVLDYNGATHGVDKQAYFYSNGATYNLPRPYKNNATFLGWYTPEDTLFPSQGVVNFNSVALHAKFKDGVGNLSYEDNGSFLKVSAGLNEAEDVFVPEWYDGKIVKEVGENAFLNDTVIKSIEFSEGLTDIGKRSFYNSNLESVKLPASLVIVGEEGFANCANLSNVDFKEGVQYLGLRAFALSGLVTIDLPSSLLELRGGTFNECSNLKRVNFARYEETSDYVITKANLANRADFRKNHPGFIITCPSGAVEKYKEAYATQYAWNDHKLAENYIVSLNHYVDGLYIKDNVLLDVKSESDTLQIENVTTIGPGAFYASGVKSVTFKHAFEVVASSFSGSNVERVEFKTNEALISKSFNYGGVNYTSPFEDGTEVVITYNSHKKTNSALFANVILEIVPERVTAQFYSKGSIVGTSTVNQGEHFTAPAILDSSFAGWYTQDGSNDVWGNKFDCEVDLAVENITLYARYVVVQRYNLNIDYNGATIKGSDKLMLCNGDEYSLTVPGKNDATFINFTYNGEEFPLEGEFTYNEDITIVANFKEASSGLEYEEISLNGVEGLAVKMGTFNGENLLIPQYHQNKKVIAVVNEGFLGLTTLKTIDIPNTMIQLGQRAFRECTNLQEFDLPESVTTVLAGAFYGDINLKKGTLRRDASLGGITTCGNNAVLRNVHNTFILYVPSTSLNQYKASKWAENNIPEIQIMAIVK